MPGKEVRTDTLKTMSSRKDRGVKNIERERTERRTDRLGSQERQ